MLRRLVSEVGEMAIHVMYLVKPSPEVIWEADHVSIGQESLEEEIGKLKFNFMFCHYWLHLAILQDKK